jgi:hypothetical protein
MQAFRGGERRDSDPRPPGPQPGAGCHGTKRVTAAPRRERVPRHQRPKTPSSWSDGHPRERCSANARSTSPHTKRTCLPILRQGSRPPRAYCRIVFAGISPSNSPICSAVRSRSSRTFEFGGLSIWLPCRRTNCVSSPPLPLWQCGRDERRTPAQPRLPIINQTSTRRRDVTGDNLERSERSVTRSNPRRRPQPNQPPTCGCVDICVHLCVHLLTSALIQSQAPWQSHSAGRATAFWGRTSWPRIVSTHGIGDRSVAGCLALQCNGVPRIRVVRERSVGAS